MQCTLSYSKGVCDLIPRLFTRENGLETGLGSGDVADKRLCQTTWLVNLCILGLHRTCNDSGLPMAPHWLEELPASPAWDDITNESDHGVRMSV